jgi:hypothetical protein
VHRKDEDFSRRQSTPKFPRDVQAIVIVEHHHIRVRLNGYRDCTSPSSFADHFVFGITSEQRSKACTDDLVVINYKNAYHGAIF